MLKDILSQLKQNRGLVWIWILSALGCGIGWMAEKNDTHASIVAYMIILAIMLLIVAILKRRIDG